MIEKENIFKYIYKYYSAYCNSLNVEKDIIRRERIINKGLYSPQILKGIRDIFRGYTVVDWTDDESCCFEFKVLLHKNVDILDDDKILIKKLKGERHDLRIFISALAPYFYMFVEKTMYLETDNRWEFSTIEKYDKEREELLIKTNNFLLEKGYYILKNADVLMLVPDIETEYKESGKVNVFDCLFTDLVTIK